MKTDSLIMKRFALSQNLSIDNNILHSAPLGLKGHCIIPHGVKEIGFGAFLNCKLLIAITLPQGVLNIGSQVFKGCDNLTKIISLSIIPPKWSDIVEPFLGLDVDNIELYVREDCFNYYKNSKWGDVFSTIKTIEINNIESQSEESIQAVLTSIEYNGSKFNVITGDYVEYFGNYVIYHSRDGRQLDFQFKEALPVILIPKDFFDSVLKKYVTTTKTRLSQDKLLIRYIF